MLLIGAPRTEAPALPGDLPEVRGGCVVVVDTETTGLPTEPGTDVVEIGAVLWDVVNGVALEGFHTLAYPKEVTAYHAEVLAQVCGIGLDLRYPPSTEARRAFWRWHAGLPGSPLVTSYPVIFDAHFLPHPAAWTHCVQQYARNFGPRRRLADLHASLDLPNPTTLALPRGLSTEDLRPHRALYDSLLAAQVLTRLSSVPLPEAVNLGQISSAAWWDLSSPCLPLPVEVHGRLNLTACSPAAHAILVRAQEVNLQVNPQWATDPPSAFLEHIPAATWRRVWEDRVSRIPVLRRGLLQTGTRPLSGHPHAQILQDIRDYLLLELAEAEPTVDPQINSLAKGVAFGARQAAIRRAKAMGVYRALKGWDADPKDAWDSPLDDSDTDDAFP